MINNISLIYQIERKMKTATKSQAWKARTGDAYPILKESEGTEQGKFRASVNRTDGYGTLAIVYGLTKNEAKANATRVAAAPELLEALTKMLAWANIKDGSPSQSLRDECLEAMKKATGE